jgi:hypothetical protein
MSMESGVKDDSSANKANRSGVRVGRVAVVVMGPASIEHIPFGRYQPNECAR